MSSAAAKKEYNKLLKRFNNATEYFEREDIGQEEKEKFLGKFQEILTGLNYQLSKIEIYHIQEIMKGFN